MGYGDPVLVHSVLKGQCVHNRRVDKTQTDRMGVTVGGFVGPLQRQRDGMITSVCV